MYKVAKAFSPEKINEKFQLRKESYYTLYTWVCYSTNP